MYEVPLDKLSIEEKLHALEVIWENLCETPDAVPSPGWHADLLQQREHAIANGEDSFEDWDVVKGQLRSEMR